MKKTFKVEELKNTVNHILSIYEENECSQDYRQGVRFILEDILFRTNNYKGFRYLCVDEVPLLERPGIREGTSFEEKFVNTDQHRVRYY